jgi:Flp pilus assembly protein CpaB
MNKKRGGSLLVGVGLLMALIAGWLGFAQLKAAELRVEQVPGRRVVVATEDIPAQGRVALSAVTIATISEQSLPARSFGEVGQVVGQFARQPVYKGDILTEDRIISLDQVRSGATGGVASSPSFVLDKDQVMVVLPAQMTGNFAGQSPTLLTAVNAIRPGDYVDLLVTTLELPEAMSREQRDEARNEHPWDYLRTRVMFQNLRVHQIGPFSDSGQNRSESRGGVGVANAAPAPSVSAQPQDRYLTFVVDRATALELKWLKDIVALGHANVDFILRSPVDQSTTPAEALTVQDIRRDFGVYGGRQLAP